MQGLACSDGGVGGKCPPAGSGPPRLAGVSEAPGALGSARRGNFLGCGSAGSGAGHPEAPHGRVGHTPKAVSARTPPHFPRPCNPSPRYLTTLLPWHTSPSLCSRAVEQQKALLTFPPAAPTAMDVKEWARQNNSLCVTAKAGKGCAAVVKAACELPLCPRDAFEVRPVPGRPAGGRPQRCSARWGLASRRRAGPPAPLRAPDAAPQPLCFCRCAFGLRPHCRLYPILTLQLFAHPDNAVIFRGIERCTYRRILWAAGDSLPGDGRQTIEVENESGAQLLQHLIFHELLFHCRLQVAGRAGPWYGGVHLATLLRCGWLGRDSRRRSLVYCWQASSPAGRPGACLRCML